MAELLLVRHPAVSRRYIGRCYGRLDVALSREGMAAVHAIAEAVALEPFSHVFASPSRRSRLLGARMAGWLRQPLTVSPALAERCFGSWEGQSWDDIWMAEGDRMNGMLDAPDQYRPGGGETTAELGARVHAWFQELPAGGSVVAATHGGPVAALAGILLGAAPSGWLDYLPPLGHGLRIDKVGTHCRITPWQPPGHDQNSRG